MSIFDKDLIERSPHVPKEDAIKYSLDWTLQRVQNYLCGYLKDHKRNSNALLFCLEYIRVKCDDLLRGIQWNSGSTIVLSQAIEHPGECWEYPAIRSYEVQLNYDYAAVQTYLFTIYIKYRTSADLTYIYYSADIEL